MSKNIFKELNEKGVCDIKLYKSHTERQNIFKILMGK